MDFMKLVCSGQLYQSVALQVRILSVFNRTRFFRMPLRNNMASIEESVNMQLVQEVEKHPLLYNYRLQEYSKRELVEAAWNDIANVMNDEAVNCKEKWRNLRTVFVRKLKPLPNGVVKRKSYYLGDAMAFLTPFIKLQKADGITDVPPSPVRSEQDNFACFEESAHIQYDEMESSSKDTVCQPFPNYPPSEVIKKIPLDQKEFPEYIESKRSKYCFSDDSRKYFLLSLLPEVQKLTDNQMKFFRRKMLDALDEAEAHPATAILIHGVSNFPQFSPKKEC